MRCPRCSFEGEPVDGTCPNCRYRRVSESERLRNPSVTGVRPPSSTLRSQSGNLNWQSGPLRAVSAPLRSPSVPLRAVSNPSRPLTNFSRPLSLYTAKRGDILNQGRYRLVDQLTLPDNQQSQGAAWLAVDLSAGQMQVVIREINIPAGDPEVRKQLIRAAALRLSEMAQHSGFPRVLGVFGSQNTSFIVLQHIEGESLASLLRRQGGALPERTVAEYGRQLCEMLVMLSRQQPPVVHGAISPETVIVSPERTRVHLLHLPLSSPREVPNNGAIGGYKSPEQARNGADPAADLYAVAATMHHAITGFDPRERIAFFYPPARRLNPVVSQQMEAILAQELRLSSPQRYADAADMQKDLTTLLSVLNPEAEKKMALIAKDTLGPDIAEIRKRSSQRNMVQLSIFACICLVILLSTIFFVGLYPLLTSPAITSPTPTPNPTATATAMLNALNAEWRAEAATYQKGQIALSDGRYAFDIYPGRIPQEMTYKTQAAQALLKNDLGTAFSDYDKAISLDPDDGEAQIYYEDLRIEMQNEPYITIVLGLPLDKEPGNLNFTRPDLQSAFVFEHQVNTQNLLPNGLKLRILVANSGGQDSGATTVAQYIANRVQIGNPDHIVAAVGWPTTGESSNASAVLTAAKVPLIAQTASGVSLNGLSSYFFRVNPNDSTQGQIQGKFAYQQLGARKVVVLRDFTDPYSVSLADAFISSFEQQGGTVIDNPADYFTEYTTTVEQYEQYAAHDVLNNHADLIFIPGYDEDAVRLAHALGQLSRIYPFYLSNVKVLGGDAVDTALLLGKGTGPDAQIALTYPQDMRRLRFTSFSDVSEWANVAQNQRPAFFLNWSQTYSKGGSVKAPVPTNDALMTADAFGVTVYAIKQVKGTLTGISLRDALASIGTGDIQPYMGVSGPIVFGSDGNPVNKPVVLLEIAYDSTTGVNEVKLVETSGTVN